MTEITPLLKHKLDVCHYDAASETKSDLIVEGEEVSVVSETGGEIPFLEIVTTLFSEWCRNGANEDLTPQDVMAMRLQYWRVTRGRQVLHTPDAITNELADTMFCHMRQAHFYNDDSYTFERRQKILRNLRKIWPSIVNFDENLARSLNVYHPPTYRERILNAWTYFQIKCTALTSSFSNFTRQLLLSMLLLCWSLSMLIMGMMSTSMCPMKWFLTIVLIVVGVMGISAILLRLILFSIEKWYWLNSRTRFSGLWNALNVMEFVLFLALTLQLWFFFGDSDGSYSKERNLCNETFYSISFWINHISVFFAVVWIVSYIAKAVSWMKRLRYHYMPPFYDYEETDTAVC